MWNGIDLTQSAQIVPFEVNPPIKLGRLTLNRNPTNSFAEPESISFAPPNVVKWVSFVPDLLLQWRLMSYDDTPTHRHNSTNGYRYQLTKHQSTITTETDTCSHCSSKELQHPHLTASEVSKKPTFNRLSHIQGLLIKLQDPATLTATSLVMTGRRKPARSGRHSTSIPSSIPWTHIASSPGMSRTPMPHKSTLIPS